MGPPYQSHQMQLLYRYCAGSSTSIIPYRSQMLLKTWRSHGQFLLTPFHYREAASKARRVLFMTRWPFTKLYLSAFTTFIKRWLGQHLEHATQACSPNLAADADCLERIQHFVAKLIKGFRRLPHEERLRRLGLHSLNSVASVETSQPVSTS